MSQAQQPIVCPRCHAETFDGSWKCWRCGKAFPYSLRRRSGPGAGQDAGRRFGCLSIFGKVVALSFLLFVLLLVLLAPERQAEHDPGTAQKATATEAQAGQPRQPKGDPSWMTQAHRNVLAHFQASEPKVKDAIWTRPDVFKVGVYDDGSKRDGFALYVCQVLAENGFGGDRVTVQVVDIVRLVANGEWIKLGSARCQ